MEILTIRKLGIVPETASQLNKNGSHVYCQVYSNQFVKRTQHFVVKPSVGNSSYYRAPRYTQHKRFSCKSIISKCLIEIVVTPRERMFSWVGLGHFCKNNGMAVQQNRFSSSLLDLQYTNKTNSSHVVKQPSLLQLPLFLPKQPKSTFSLQVSTISMIFPSQVNFLLSAS